MNDNSVRRLLVTGLGLNVLFLMLALLDYALAQSRFMWPIFVAWAFLILLMAILSLANSGLRLRIVQVVQQDETRTFAPPPVKAQPAPSPAVTAPAASGIPFRYNGYTLYGRDVELKNGGKRPIYFFAKATPASGHMVAKPANMHVGVNERTGLPFLKKGAGADGEDLTPHTEEAYRPQCSALTEEGHQCRNSARHDSKYCASHFGYQPPAIAKAAAKREDTAPRVKDAPDTLPSVRRKAAA